MSIVQTPAGSTSIESVRLLTNLMGSSIALELAPGEVTNLEPDKLLFYDSVVDSDQRSAGYNLDTINTLVSNGVLRDVTLTLINPTPRVKTLEGGTFVANVTSNKNVKITTKEYNQATNHLEVYPVVDEYSRLLIIYYRDAEGISYSLNGGLSSVLIDNSNLIYPDEITSMAVQIYDLPNSRKPILKLFIGTLREGIKTFIPGVDTTYKQCDGMNDTIGSVYVPPVLNSDGSVHTPAIPSTIDYKFKNSVQSPSNALEFIDSGFAPVYILGILNFTLNNGCPLITYTRVMQNGSNRHKFCIKNLHSRVYNSQSKAFIDVDTSWVISNNATLLANVNNIIDIFYSIDCNRSNVSGSVSTKLVALKRFSYTQNKIVTEFIKLSSTDTTTFDISLVPAPPAEVLFSYITGLSYFMDPVTGIESIFVTTDSGVWQYTNSAWSLLIGQSVSTSTVLTRALSTGLNSSLQLINTNTTPTTYLTNLVGFSIAQIPDISNEYLGFLGSNVGIIQYQFTCIDGKLTIKDTTKFPAKVIRTDLYGSYTTSLVVPSGTSIVLSCNLKTSVPLVYDVASNSFYFSYIPDDIASLTTPTSITKTTEIFSRANYLIYTSDSESITDFYNNSTFSEFNYTPTDQFIDIKSISEPEIKLKPLLSSHILSNYYEQKFLYFVNNAASRDETLFLYLNRSFGKYMRLYISHTVTNTVTIEPNVYVLTGTSTYYVPVIATNEVLDSVVTTYFDDGYIYDGYTTVISE